MIITVDELLRQDIKGKIVVFPTDTVYGVGCLYDDLEAIDRIYQLKERDYDKPMAILAHDAEQLRPLVLINDRFADLAAKHWPGALTLVARKTDAVSIIATANRDTVGVRIPAHDTALRLLAHFGPMVTTSLNRTGEPALLAFADVLRYQEKVDYIVDGGDLDAVASTVYDTLANQVLRQGRIVIEP